MFDLYSEAGKVVRKALNKETNIRTAIYASNFKNKKQLLRLCCETLRFRTCLDRILEVKELHDLLKNGHFDRYLLYVLLYDHIFGQGLRKAKKAYSDAILKRSVYIDQQVSSIHFSTSLFISWVSSIFILRAQLLIFHLQLACTILQFIKIT
ncbi:unnamed protein product [Onchocerca flexuosa]|uniref:14_3_3 domain-containing protein n=1 Tax=Onchocerca flexuosa TaxID=387005 RepID=A0A183HGB8_9BILA|nr:unnamed protein product [Onchocerca flexuosa]